MNRYIVDLNSHEQVNINAVGGKGFNLMQLSALPNIHVPEGFCITTEAYSDMIKGTSVIPFLEQLSSYTLDDREDIVVLCKKIRQAIVDIELSSDLKEYIVNQISEVGRDISYAVRSSATAEDMPTASFAGQHDTYLNVMGIEAILHHVKMCWASLYTERAVTYRIQNGFDHQEVSIAIVVQKMITPDTSGIMFTAEPNTSNRKVVAIDASFGLGEALVSGLVNADHYQVRDKKIIKKIIGKKELALYPNRTGGTYEKVITDDSMHNQALTDEQIIMLEETGRLIESYFGCPQDIEWCIKDNQLYIVQSRPITTLFPLPTSENGEIRVLISTGHLQMMTFSIKPLGLSFLQMALGDAPYQLIGGYLYNDITHDLATPIGRLMVKKLLGMIGDNLMTDGIIQITKDKSLLKSLAKGTDKTFKTEKGPNGFKVMSNMIKQYRESNPDTVKPFIDQEEDAIAKMQKEISNLSGAALIDYIYDDHTDRRFKIVNPENAATLGMPILLSMWFNRIVKKVTGEINAADTIIKSIPYSVTSDTADDLLDVSDVVRQYPEVLTYFESANDLSFFEDLEQINGGLVVSEAIKMYLTKYGMRCSGDIDITVPRWKEKPTMLIPLILNNIKNFEPGARNRLHAEGIADYEKKMALWSQKLESKLGGKRRANRLRKIGDIIRNISGYREYPKFSYMKRYLTYKEHMLTEADQLVKEGVIHDREDIFYLYLKELMEVVKTRTLDYNIIETRKRDYKSYEHLTPQRIITSDGDVIEGNYDSKDFPANALVGVPVSAGVIEGRARVIHSMADADFEEGDILVTEFTDPSWTPVFISISGLITEVGGVSTHGAVISREYGLPAIVSVENATKIIRDGQRIRLDGSRGFVEIVDNIH